MCITRAELLVCRLAKVDFTLLAPLTLGTYLLGELQVVHRFTRFPGRHLLSSLSLAPFPFLALQRLYALELVLLLAIIMAVALVPVVLVVSAPALAQDRMVFAIA